MHSPASQLLAAALLASALTLPGQAADSGALALVSFVPPQPPPKPASQAAQAEPPREVLAPHQIVQILRDELAPDPAADEHELLPLEEFTTLVRRLCAAGQSNDLDQLAGFAPEARRAIASLRSRPGFENYAAWLHNQLDEIDAAEAAQALAAAQPAPLFTPPPSPEASAEPAVGAIYPRVVAVPYFDLWLGRMAERPRPARADEFLPSLRAAFAAEGVPPALVWLAETESSFNPRARNPIGARGLFQIMPETARSLGLGLWPDERVHPVRSAHAAASYLRYLHGRFGDWPLALAAYNAGEGRVSRELRRRDASDFAGIARHLPAETRLYVPKVLATIQVREGVHPADLPAPRS